MSEKENEILKQIYEIVFRFDQWKDDQEKNTKQFWDKDWKELKIILQYHEKRLNKLKRWQAMSVGIAITCSTLLAIIIRLWKV